MKKKGFIFSLAVALLILALVIFPVTADSMIYGDLTGNGEVTVSDAIIVLRYIVGLATLSPKQEIAADVNQDAEINVTDAIVILRYIVGLVKNLPIGDDYQEPDPDPLDIYDPHFVIQNAKISSFRFYESGFGDVPYDNRFYKDIFPQEDTRYINWELVIEFPKPGNNILFPITQKFYDPYGSLIANLTEEFYINYDYTVFTICWGWGYDMPGYWNAGVYEVKIFVEDSVIVRDYFEIY